jgi:hypothetical protein
MSKAATSALGVGSLEWLNSSAQSDYASGNPVPLRTGAVLLRLVLVGPCDASVPITINASIYLIQHMRRGYNISKASDRQESVLK